VPSAKRLRDRLRKAIEDVSSPADDVPRWAEPRNDGREHDTGCDDSDYEEHGAMPARTHGRSLEASGPDRKAEAYA
jgi:hypothetical protein